MRLAALGPAGPYTSRASTSVRDASGAPAIELSSVPRLVVAHWIEAVRGCEPLPPAETPSILAKAADIFSDQDILGDNLDAHELRLAALTGTPISVIRESDQLITSTLRDVLRKPNLAVPAGCGGIDGRAATAVWRRVGDVFAVHAAGNSPGVHAQWLDALALGYRVVVRPSSRDPLTPYRLITALRVAGVPAGQLVLVPTDHSTAGSLIDRADLALVYGGQDVVDTYRQRRHVLTQGPGRSKLVVCADADRDAGMELALAGALYHAGSACTATTGILVEHDPVGFARDLAEALREVPVAPPWEEDARLPGMPAEDASALVSVVLSRIQPGALRLPPMVRRIGGPGSLSVITPAVIELPAADDPLLSYELPFPCVWVAPWQPDAVACLDNSLVVSLHTGDAMLVDRVLGLPEVANVYHGRPTSWTHPDVPHDAFLAEFLMRTKGYGHDNQ